MANLLLLNGPNLNLLGTREPAVYGSTTLADIERRCVELARELGPHELACFQSNAEHALLEVLALPRERSEVPRALSDHHALAARGGG